jgi:hypothetical protein
MDTAIIILTLCLASNPEVPCKTKEIPALQTHTGEFCERIERRDPIADQIVRIYSQHLLAPGWTIATVQCTTGSERFT